MQRQRYAVTLDDGRVVTLPADSPEEASRWAERWVSFNPAGEGEYGTYQVELEGGDVYDVPAISQEAAAEYFNAWTPEIMAREDATERQRGAAGVNLDGSPSAYDGTMNAVNAASFGLDKMLNAGVSAGVTGLQNLTGNGPGYGMREAFDASRFAQNRAQDDFNAENPEMSLLTGLLGGAGAPGIGAAGRFVQGGRGLFGRAAQQAGRTNSTAGQAARAAIVSAPAGAAQGALNADPGQEAAAARNGGIAAGLFGGAMPIAGRGATALARATGVAAIPSMINRVTGGRFNFGATADDLAMGQFGDSLGQDGMTQAELQAIVAARPGVNLLDAIGPNATRTRALMQGAAMQPGPAQTAAMNYRNTVAESLQDRAIARAYDLTPGETRTAEQFRTANSDLQDRLAAEDYRVPYETRIPMTQDLDRALADVPGEIGRARTGSRYRFPAQAAEMDDLMDPNTGTVDLSAATLDQIQQRFGRTARNARRSLEDADNALAADMTARQATIDGALDNVPALSEARAVFRGYQQGIDGTELGQRALAPSTRPADYADELARMQAISEEAERIAPRQMPDARLGASVGLRDDIVNKIGNLGEGSTGILNRLATAPNPREVMEATYGPAAAPFRQDIGQMVDSLNNARFIDPTTGSQTAIRRAAENLVAPPALTPTNILFSVIDKIQRGATLTDAEREALVRLGTVSMDPNNIPTPRFRTPSVSGRTAPWLGVQASGQEY